MAKSSSEPSSDRNCDTSTRQHSPPLETKRVPPPQESHKSLFSNIINQSVASKKVSPAVAEFITNSTKTDQQSHVGGIFAQWIRHCESQEVDPIRPTLNALAEYILQLKDRRHSIAGINMCVNNIQVMWKDEFWQLMQDPTIIKLLSLIRSNLRKRPPFFPPWGGAPQIY